MCETKIVSSPLGPVAGRFVLGLGVAAGLPAALLLVPSATLWLLGALGLTTTWAAVATIIAIRQRADTRLEAPPQTVAPPAPGRAHAEIIASRARRPELAAGAPELTQAEADWIATHQAARRTR